MPLNGKANPVSKPSWLKDTPAAQSSTSTPAARPSWARKTPEAKKDDSPASDDNVVKLPFPKSIKKDVEGPKKDVTVKLQSREIKVPFKVEKTIPTQTILKKPAAKEKVEEKPKEEPKLSNFRDSKTPSKSPTTASSKSTSTTPSKSPSTTPSKSVSTTPSKSPSKTPDYDSDEDEESSYESETDSSEETDSDEDYDSDVKPSYKPPSPGALRKHLIIPNLKKVSKSPETEKSEPERSSSPDYTFKKPELKKVVTRQREETKERSASPEPKFIKPNLRKVPSSLRTKEPPAREKLPTVELKKAPPKAEPEKSTRKMSEQFPHKPSILRAESSKKSKQI